MRTHMTDIIPERVALEKLQETNVNLLKQIDLLELENVTLADSLKELNVADEVVSVDEKTDNDQL